MALLTPPGLGSEVTTHCQSLPHTLHSLLHPSQPCIQIQEPEQQTRALTGGLAKGAKLNIGNERPKDSARADCHPELSQFQGRFPENKYP